MTEVTLLFFSILGNSNYYYKDSMDPVSARGSFIWFLITALSVKAGSLANDAQPHRKAALTLVDALRQNEGLINSPTDLKAILPVEVDISDLVSKFNVRFQALGGKVTRLGDQLRIIEEENARVQNAFKEKLTKLETQLQTSKEEADGLREQLKASNEQKAGQQCPQGRKGAECRRNLCPQGRKGAECRKNNNPDDSDDDDDDGNDCSGLIYSFHGPLITRDGAKADCENRGLKLAEPKTTHQVKCLMSTLPSNKNYWIGGECVGCSEVTEDKWQWSNGGKIALNNPSWKKGLPSDTGIHDAFFLTIKKAVGFVNHEPLHKYNYVCE